MHEYERLERRWRRYRLKRFFLYLFYLLILTLFVAGGWSIWQKDLIPNFSMPSNDKVIVTNNYLFPSLEFEKRLDKKEKNLDKLSERKQKAKRPQKHITRERKKPKSSPQPLTITSQNIALNDIIRDFKKKPTPALALLIAKKYFVRGDYEKSLKWSIKANELDKENEESWILYAKSASRLGDKKRAMQALLIIIKKSNSEEAKRLLRMLAQGQQI